MVSIGDFVKLSWARGYFVVTEINAWDGRVFAREFGKDFSSPIGYIGDQELITEADYLDAMAKIEPLMTTEDPQELEELSRLASFVEAWEERQYPDMFGESEGE